MFARTPSLVRMLLIASTTRAFTVQPTRFATQVHVFRGSRQFWSSKVLTMSTSEPDTTVVATCRDKISAALGTEEVVVTGAYDDPNGSHISIKVVSAKFEGKRPMQRQQMVYKAIWDEMQGAVHAVDSMICKAPNEA